MAHPFVNVIGKLRKVGDEFGNQIARGGVIRCAIAPSPARIEQRWIDPRHGHRNFKPKVRVFDGFSDADQRIAIELRSAAVA